MSSDSESPLRQLINKSRTALKTTEEMGAQLREKYEDAKFRKYQNLASKHWRNAFDAFHNARHERPLQLIGAAVTAAVVCSVPAGPGAVVRTAAFSTALAVAVVAPEYYATLWKSIKQ